MWNPVSAESWDLQYPEWQDWNPAFLRFHSLYKADGGQSLKSLEKDSKLYGSEVEQKKSEL